MMKFQLRDVRLVQICIAMSIFSQIEVVSFIFRPLMYVSWIITIGYYVIKYAHDFYLNKVTKVFFLSYVLLFILCIIASIVTEDHLNGNYIHIMAIPLLVTIVGGFFGQKCTEAELQIILKTYVFCTLMYAIWVHLTYYASYSDWLKQTMYAFLQKNSAAQIWSVGVLIAFFLIDYKSKMQKFIGYIITIYLVVISGISQCRTALLALGVVACMYILFKSKHKIRWMVIFIVLFVFMWNFSITRDFIDQALFLTKYADADLNTFSSGRLGHWQTAINVFWENPIWGKGRYYVDCSYLCVLAEVGSIGFVLVESVWLLRIYYNFNKSTSKGNDFLFCVTLFYLVESFLEGYPPFGPGVSSFMFWFLSSTYTKNTLKKIQSES